MLFISAKYATKSLTTAIILGETADECFDKSVLYITRCFGYIHLIKNLVYENIEAQMRKR